MLKELFERWREKKNEEKEELKKMERDLRLQRRLENKLKSPMQKEHEFYERERNKENLKLIVKKEREDRDKRMKELSSPFNKPCMNNMFGINREVMGVGMRWT